MDNFKLPLVFRSLIIAVLFLAYISESLSQADSSLIVEYDLINAAWLNSSEKKKLSYEMQIAEEEQMLHKWYWWTEGLTVQFNYNEAHARNNNDLLVQGLVFPRFNLGASFNIGNLFNYKREQRIRGLSIKIVESERDHERAKVTSQVRESYQNYLFAEELLELRIQAEVDANEGYALASALFKANEMGLDEFKKVASDYYTAKEATLEARLNKKLSKIRLEALLGHPLAE